LKYVPIVELPGLQEDDEYEKDQSLSVQSEEN
jgi:hypothetical protein